MYRTIVVPVDGSPLAEHAIPWALAVAANGAAVHLAHVHVPATPVVVEGVVVADPTLDASLRKIDSEYLAKLAERVRTAAPTARVGGLTLDAEDSLPEALADAADELNAELLVMTTHGRGPFARFLLGSVTDETIRSTHVPILIVHGLEESGPDLTTRPNLTGEVLVPLDGSDWSESILEPAARLAELFDSGITVMMVDGREKVESGLQPKEYLNGVAGRLSVRGLKARPHLVQGGDPAEVILKYAADHPRTVIALSTHGRTGISWLIHRSIAEEVAHSTAAPILLYRPRG